jgi:outer membrane protein assembly factor BamE (lipoprotein component of BamABCDE complex)
MNYSHRHIVSLGCLILLLAGCVSVGAEFPTPTSAMIKNGVTTRTELRQLFGSPTQVGIEDGDQTWTWLHVRAGAIGRTLSKELHVKFTERGVVKSYSYTSSLPEEVQRDTR